MSKATRIGDSTDHHEQSSATLMRLAITALVLVMALSLFSIPVGRAVGATGWSTPQIISGTSEQVYFSSIAVDNAGAAHIVYWTDPPGDIKYVTNESGSWSAPVGINNDGRNYVFCHIRVDSSGKLHLVYMDNTGYGGFYGIVYYRSKPKGGPWSDPVLLSGSDTACEQPELAVDRNGVCHVVYKSQSIGDRYTDNASGSWSAPVTLPTSGFYSAGSLDTDADCTVHYMDNGGTYINNKGWTWTTPEAAIPELGWGGILVDSKGHCHFVYWTRGGSGPRDTGIVRYVNNVSGSWSTPQDVTGQSGQDVENHECAAFDANDTLHVVYDDYNGTAKCRPFYTALTNGQWSTPVLLEDDPAGGRAPQIGAGGGKVYVAYTAVTDTGISPLKCTFFPARKQTTLSLNHPDPVQYSDDLRISATLLDQDSQPVGGKTVTFSLEGRSQDVTTDSNGVATWTTKVDLPSRTYPVKANFAGDDALLASSVEVPVTVTKEAATVSYTGDSLRSVTQTVSLSATVDEEAGGSPGDITKAPLVFEIWNSQGKVGEVSANTTEVIPGHGLATTTTGPLRADAYTIKVRLADNGYYAAPGISAGLNVYDPKGGCLTGAGVMTSCGVKAFVFKSCYPTASSTIPTGTLLFTDLSSARSPVTILAQGFKYLVIPKSGNQAYLAGACTFNGTKGYSFKVDVQDNARCLNTKDVLHLVVQDPQGKVVYEVGGTIAGDIAICR